MAYIMTFDFGMFGDRIYIDNRLKINTLNLCKVGNYPYLCNAGRQECHRWTNESPAVCPLGLSGAKDIKCSKDIK